MVAFFIAGGLLGLFFYLGLWWTVNKISGSGNPYLAVTVSFIIRTTAALALFYFILQSGWQCLLVALAGFIIARTVLAYKLKPEKKERKEVS